MYRFILIEALLKPVIGIPEPVLGSVNAVFGQSLIISGAFLKMGKQIKKVGQLLFPDIDKVVRIRTDKTGNKIGTVL